MSEELTTAEQKVQEIVNELPYGVDEEAVTAFVELMGAEWATTQDFEDSYQGHYYNDEEFAKDFADQMGLGETQEWPYSCIDWSQAAQELMYDYSEEGGYYFRNI